MELYERVRLLKRYTGSIEKLGELMGIAQQRITSWSNEKSQINFYRHLPKLLESLPNIRREWLYFEDGPMLKTEVEGEPAIVEDLRQQVRTLTETNRRLAETNQKLVEKLLGVDQPAEK